MQPRRFICECRATFTQLERGDCFLVVVARLLKLRIPRHGPVSTTMNLCPRHHAAARCLRIFKPGLSCVPLVLAAAGAAHAQGTVTLYGTIDTSIEVTNPGNGWTTRMDSGAYRGSRVGLRGNEPIDAGTSVIFDLENGFGSTNGSLDTPGSIFNRQAWVGFDAPWGQTRFGRQYSPLYIPFKGGLDAFGAGTIGSGLNNLSKITPYTDNAFTWISPTIAGFDVTGMYALRDPGDGNGIGGYYVTANYSLDKLRLSYARQQTHGDASLRANFGGVSYLFGPVHAYAAIFNGDGGSPRYHDDGVSISASWDLSTQARASLGFAHARDRSGQGNNADQFSVAFEYTLSRSVVLYFTAADLENRGNAQFVLRGVNVTGLPVAYPGAPVRGVQAGMIERF
ncbi:gram-negative porin domain protein [Caballeronia sordidicola]|uniref:Gram-negative porin domain protein n=2 Tax=Caballeronia sordidicola TaxID=196367 RepID=A0A158H7H4_CABSO|nr:gram-negative porin domain protein [Caballeronia sordidicola]